MSTLKPLLLAGIFFSLIFSSQLSSRPFKEKTLRNHFEVTGTLQIIVGDHVGPGQIEEIYSVEDSQSGESYELLFGVMEKSHLKAGMEVRARGRLVERPSLYTPGQNSVVLRLEELKVLAAPKTKKISALGGPFEVNHFITAIKVQPEGTKFSSSCTHQLIENRLFGSTQSIKSQIELASDGKTKIDGVLYDPVIEVPLVQDFCKANTLANAAQAEIKRLGLKLSNRVIYVYPDDIWKKCNGIGGWGQVKNNLPDTQSAAWLFACSLNMVYVHEFGHNMGFGHAQRQINPDTISEYADWSDFMGNRGVDLSNAPHRIQQGWLETHDTQRISESGEYRISDLDTNLGIPKVLYFKTESPVEEYFLSFRRRENLSNIAGGLAGDRLNVHTWPNRYKTRMVDLLNQGDASEFSFHDRENLKVVVTVKEIREEDLTVSIQFPDVNRPILHPIADQFTKENEEVRFQVEASHTHGLPVTVKVHGLPQGASFDGRTFVWTPQFNQGGEYFFTFVASDGTKSDTLLVRLYVDQVNLPPEIQAISDQEIDLSKEQWLRFPLVLSDPDFDSLSVRVEGVPGAQVFWDSRTKKGGFEWEPKQEHLGVHSAKVIVSDGKLEASQSFSILVKGANLPPEAKDDYGDTLQNAPIFIDVLKNDRDLNEDPLKIQAVGPATKGVVRIEDGKVHYLPHLDVFGSDQFTYTVVDPGGLTSSAQVFVTIYRTNKDPVLEADQASAIGNNPILIDVLANDSDEDGDTLSVVGVTSPSHGTATWDGTAGRIRYQAFSDFFGVDSFEYHVEDGFGGTGSAEVQVDVRRVNTPPQAADDQFEGWEGQPLLLTVLENDSDPNGDPLKIVSLEQGKHGVATLSEDQTEISYLPEPKFFGNDQISYSIEDGAGGSAKAFVSITIKNVIDPAVARADQVSGVQLNRIRLNVFENDDPSEDGNLKIQGFTNTEKGKLHDLGKGIFEYVPDSDFVGTDGFEYWVNELPQGKAKVSIEILEDPEAKTNTVWNNPESGDSRCAFKRSVCIRAFDALGERIPCFQSEQKGKAFCERDLAMERYLPQVARKATGEQRCAVQKKACLTAYHRDGEERSCIESQTNLSAVCTAQNEFNRHFVWNTMRSGGLRCVQGRSICLKSWDAEGNLISCEASIKKGFAACLNDLTIMNLFRTGIRVSGDEACQKVKADCVLSFDHEGNPKSCNEVVEKLRVGCLR